VPVNKSNFMEGTFSSISTDDLAERIARKILSEISTRIESVSSPDQPKLLTSAEVAKICKVKSLSTLWYWRKKNLLVPTSRAGRKPLYKYQDVLNFLEGRNRASVLNS
jgi:hypothetical protein